MSVCLCFCLPRLSKQRVQTLRNFVHVIPVAVTTVQCAVANMVYSHSDSRGRNMMSTIALMLFTQVTRHKASTSIR